jgi:hypothetical protein
VPSVPSGCIPSSPFGDDSVDRSQLVVSGADPWVRINTVKGACQSGDSPRFPSPHYNRNARLVPAPAMSLPLSSRPAGPTAMTLPRCGFPWAVSGMRCRQRSWPRHRSRDDIAVVKRSEFHPCLPTVLSKRLADLEPDRYFESYAGAYSRSASVLNFCRLWVRYLRDRELLKDEDPSP